MDVRNLIFPMTARDLVESAQVLCQVERGDGPDMRLCEVTSVERVVEGVLVAPTLQITFKDTATLETWQTVLHPDTPLLITGLRRS